MSDQIGDWKRSHYTAEVPSKDGEQVTVMGWVREVRDIGKLKFIVLADREGFVQITAKKGETAEATMKKIDTLTRESVITVKGKIKANKQAPGGREILPEEIRILSLSEQPLPLEVTGKTPALLDTRLDERFLDLRRPEVQSVFQIQNQILKTFRDILYSKSFKEIWPPEIIAAASEGGAELFTLPYYEKEAFLAQSPQLYKEMAVVGGMDKVMMIVPVWRAELSHTVKHLTEIRQMDIEMGFIRDEEDVMKIIEEVVFKIIEDIRNKCKKELETIGYNLKLPKFPFPRVKYTDALKMLEKEGIKMEWGEDIGSEAEKKICELIGLDQPFFITQWPTKVRAFYSMPYSDNPKICRAFDLMYQGMELASGAQRIHIPKLLIEQLKERKLNPESFKFFTDIFKYGAPPHGGWSIGLERLTMKICGLENVREAALFPRDVKRLTP